MIPDTGSLSSILQQFLSIFQLGQKGVAIEAWSLLTILATIELTLAGLWWAATGSEVLVPLMRKLLVLGFFVFVVQNYPTLLSAVIEGFIHTGKTASSGGGDVLASVRDPSTIIDAGFFIALPILEHLKSYSGLDVLTHIHDIMITGFCALGILAAYFIIAIQVFVTYLEFAIISTLGLILIPFGVFKHTAFLAEKVFGAIISFGVKLMVLGFLVSVTVPILKVFNVPADPSWTQLFNLLVVCFAVAALAWHAPGVAAGLLSGGPSLTAGTAAGSALAGTAAGIGTVLATSAASKAPFQIGASALQGAGSLTKFASGTLGTASGGAQVASHLATQAGGSNISKTSMGALGAVKSVLKTSGSTIAKPFTQPFAGVGNTFQTKQSAVQGFSAMMAQRNTSAVSSTTSQSSGSSGNSSLVSNCGENKENPSSTGNKSTATQNASSKNKVAAALHLAKESVPHTAEPQGGLHVPIKTEEEPKP